MNKNLLASGLLHNFPRSKEDLKLATAITAATSEAPNIIALLSIPKHTLAISLQVNHNTLHNHKGTIPLIVEQTKTSRELKVTTDNRVDLLLAMSMFNR
jgi:hypothetical protein